MNAVTKQMELQPVPQVEQAALPTAMTPMAMIDRAIASGANIETLERLMALQERWEASEAKKEFDNAISEAKAEIRPIVKRRHVGYDSKKAEAGRTEYDYEDLAAIAEVVDPILTKHGLSYRFNARQDNGKIFVTCIVSHRRGHREETTLDAAPDVSGSKNPIQGIGSAVTYLQRYTLKLALGLSATKDDDGNGAVVHDGPKLIDDAQYRYLVDLIEKAAASEEKILAHCKVERLEDFTQKDFKWCEAMLRKRIADGKGKQ